MESNRRYFCDLSKTKIGSSPPSKRSCLADDLSTSGSSSTVPISIPNITQPVSPKISVIFSMDENSLHDSGIKPEYLPTHEKLPHIKAMYICCFSCDYQAESRVTVCTHIHKEHLHVMLGCPHFKHKVWSADAWAKHICAYHPDLPVFRVMKSECLSPKESEKFLYTLVL